MLQLTRPLQAPEPMLAGSRRKTLGWAIRLSVLLLLASGCDRAVDPPSAETKPANIPTIATAPAATEPAQAIAVTPGIPVSSDPSGDDPPELSLAQALTNEVIDAGQIVRIRGTFELVAPRGSWALFCDQDRCAFAYPHAGIERMFSTDFASRPGYLDAFVEPRQFDEAAIKTFKDAGYVAGRRRPMEHALNTVRTRVD